MNTTTLHVTYTGTSSWPALRINEFMATNQGPVLDPADSKPDDWFELYNPTAATVNLSGWSLSDDAANPRQFIIPAGFSIPANGYLLVWADGESFQNAPSTRPDLHVDFKLSAAGESILLSAPDTTLIDSVTFGAQQPGVSQGLWAGSGATILPMTTATPGAANAFTPPAPAYTGHTISSAGVVTLTWTAIPGATYRIRRATTLADWQTLATTVAPTAEGSYADPSPPPTRAFYVIELVTP